MSLFAPISIYGGTATFTVTPAVDYAANMGGNCGGTLSGNMFTTKVVHASCSVTATFVYDILFRNGFQ